MVVCILPKQLGNSNSHTGPPANFASNIARIQANSLAFSLKSSENHKFSDDFSANKSLIDSPKFI